MGKKFSKALAAALSAVMTASVMTAAVSAAGFTDVPSDSWFYNAVTACADKGYVTGVGNGAFSPDSQVTYAQFAVMAYQAFYPGDLTLEAPWYVPYITAGQRQGIFEGTMAGIPTATTPLTRYEMARIAANILAGYGKTADPARVAEIQQSITDWADILDNCQSAVVTCFGLGVLSGYADGRFGGEDTLTRAQACVILNSLEKAAEGADFQPTTPARPENPPAGDDSPKLANGKDITEENVLEILAEVEKEFPTGTKWNDSYDTDNHYNTNSISKPVLDTLYTYNIGAKYACGGFAAMVSDLVFGYNNPCRKLDDISEIRPGDIIVLMKNGKATHVQIAMSTPVNDTNKVRVAEGNVNDQVMWPSSDLPNFSRPGNNNTTWAVYTRYPD